MRKLLMTTVVAVTLFGTVQSAYAQHELKDTTEDYPKYGIQFMGGIGTLSDFPRLDNPYSLGGFVHLSPFRFPLGLELGGMYWRDDEDLPPDGDVKISGLDGYVGLHLRGIIEGAPYIPYVGAGVVFSQVDFDVNEPTGSVFPSFGTDDTTVGFYGRVGAHYLISERLSVGADLRMVIGTDLEMYNPGNTKFTVDNIDGFHGSLFLGFNF